MQFQKKQRSKHERFKDKVAVITGAASGIGRGLAKYCSQEKMKIVLADIEERALLLAGAEIKADGTDILTVGRAHVTA
ncbi:MAG: SDR family NAD(P)-dependent oxidoreductase [Desulfobacteraceae bacterium]|nr:SDR family NAD(P)-dependent oxidoreductase [Desulfobacteraceae bacterium]